MGFVSMDSGFKVRKNGNPIRPVDESAGAEGRRVGVGEMSIGPEIVRDRRDPSASNGAVDARTHEITVVMPCLNEEEAIASCVEEALNGIELARIKGEVIVVDNGSSDNSARLAAAAGARGTRLSAGADLKAHSI